MKTAAWAKARARQGCVVSTVEEHWKLRSCRMGPDILSSVQIDFLRCMTDKRSPGGGGKEKGSHSCAFLRGQEPARKQWRQAGDKL
eukprot:1159099-Pelagomonas_calceolata.AAC.5